MYVYSKHTNVLHVSPGEVAVGLQRERADAGGKRRRRGRARVRHRTRVVQVRCYHLYRSIFSHKAKKYSKNNLVNTTSFMKSI